MSKTVTIPVEMLEEIVQGAFDRGVKYAGVEEEIRKTIGKKFVVSLLKILSEKGRITNG